MTLLTVFCSSVLVVSCGEEPAGFPVVEGWTQTGDVRVYNADNLWEYIDGAAVLFVEYGVRTCTTADMAAGQVSLTVDLYEMGSPLGAVGVFKRESAGRGMPLAGATVAALSPPYQGLMVKGNTYVKVNVYEGELSDSEISQLLQGLAAAVPGEAVMPHEFSLLPEAGKVLGSEGYDLGSHLSLSELTDCIYADYEGSGGESWEGFLVLPSAATTVWEALADSWESFEYRGHRVLFREVPYSGLVGVTRTEDGVFGVAGVANENRLRKRLGEFAQLR